MNPSQTFLGGKGGIFIGPGVYIYHVCNPCFVPFLKRFFGPACERVAGMGSCLSVSVVVVVVIAVFVYFVSFVISIYGTLDDRNISKRLNMDSKPRST